MSVLTHSIPRNKALVPRGCAHATCGMRLCSANSTLVSWKTQPNTTNHHRKHNQIETSFKTNFLLMKRENSVTSCFVVLTFQIGENMMASQRNICFLKHRIFVGFSWMMTASIQLMTGTMDGCLILNKLGRRRVALCPRVMATQNVSIFELFFSCPTPTLLLLTPILHGLGEVTHSELLGMEGG